LTCGCGAFLALLLSAATVGVLWIMPRTGNVDIGAFKVEAQPTIEWLEKYRVEHGRYPEELPPEFREGLERFSDFSYRAYDGGSSFELSFGDYMRDGFSLWWDSDRGDWYKDT
jgi:hypothetical protein